MMPDPAAFPGATGAADEWQPARPARPPAASIGELPERDAALLGFVVEMYGVQLDQLAALLADWGEPAVGGQVSVGERRSPVLDSENPGRGLP
jgi:hypothetical protein